MSGEEHSGRSGHAAPVFVRALVLGWLKEYAQS